MGTVHGILDGQTWKEIVRRMGYEFQFGRYIWYNWFHVWMRSQYSVFGLEVWQRVESAVQLKIQL